MISNHIKQGTLGIGIVVMNSSSDSPHPRLFQCYASSLPLFRGENLPVWLQLSGLCTGFSQPVILCYIMLCYIVLYYNIISETRSASSLWSAGDETFVRTVLLDSWVQRPEDESTPNEQGNLNSHKKNKKKHDNKRSNQKSHNPNHEYNKTKVIIAIINHDSENENKTNSDNCNRNNGSKQPYW